MQVTTTSFDIRDFGAVGDGKTGNTAAIQAAIDACAVAGGGRVVVPAGVFVSGAIALKSCIELHLAAGAVLQGSRDFRDYPLMDFEMQGYRVRHWPASLVTGVGLHDVSITGHGTLDGQGDVWWKYIDEKGDLPRPVLISLNDCDRVLVRDIRAMNSPSWTFRLMVCRNLVVDGVSVKNPWRQYRNNDGINLVSCRDARVVNCHVDTGDDGITLKSIPDYHMVCIGRPDYTKPHIPCENILVGNCLVRHAHGGVVIGSETVGGVRNVTVSNCIFEGTRGGVYVKGSQYGGTVENLQVSNVIMRGVELALNIEVETGYGDGPRGPYDRVATVRNCQFQHITMESVCQAIRIVGHAQSPARDISFHGLRMEADTGVDLTHAENVLLDDVTLSCRSVPLCARDVTGLEVRRFVSQPFTPELPVVQCERVRDALIHDCPARPGTSVFLGLVGDENTIELANNRLAGVKSQSPAPPVASWNVCSHAFSGSRWIRDTGTHNAWLPATEAVIRFIRERWTPEQVDGIYSISRVEANSRPGAEVERGEECRRIYIIESWNVLERLVIFEDGELLRTVEDPLFHAHYEERQEDAELPRIDAHE